MAEWQSGESWNLSANREESQQKASQSELQDLGKAQELEATVYYKMKICDENRRIPWKSIWDQLDTGLPNHFTEPRDNDSHTLAGFFPWERVGTAFQELFWKILWGDKCARLSKCAYSVPPTNRSKMKDAGSCLSRGTNNWDPNTGTPGRVDGKVSYNKLGDSVKFYTLNNKAASLSLTHFSFPNHRHHVYIS